MSILSSNARELLYEWVTADSLRKHCEAVAACMRHFARQHNANEDLWSAVALLHDMDYERYPDMPDASADLSAVSQAILAGQADSTALPGHPFYGVAYLQAHGWSQEICRAILSHADFSGIPRVTPLEKTLYAVDELSGFVTAVALVRPDKSIHSVEVSSVRKKLKDKAFAAKVSREDIARGAAELELPLETLIEQVILALRNEATALGLEGLRA